jgi:glycosyltransferase involved in cell wall biosynthesis
MNGKNCKDSGNKHLCFITAILITGGGDRLLQSICPRLKKLGYAITIFAAYPLRGKSSIRSDFEHQGITVKMPPPYISKILLMGIGLIPFTPSFILYPICCLNLNKSIVFYKKVYHWVEKNFVYPIFHCFLIVRVICDHHFKQYFIISGYMAGMYPVLYRLKKMLKIQVFYTEISSPQWRIGGTNKKKTQMYLNTFDKIFVPSSIIGKELEKFEGLQNIFYTIPFFIDLPKFVYQTPQTPARSFGLIARLSPEKNQDILIETLYIVKKNISDVTLVLIGTGPLKQQLITIAISLGVLEDIRFIDNFEKIEEVIQKIDIFTLVSDVEGMPLTIIEALYFGKPVIATPVGSIPDMIVDGYNGYIIDKNQIRDIADHIIELMENDNQYKMMSQNSRLVYERKFDPDTLFSELLLHYKDSNS